MSDIPYQAKTPQSSSSSAGSVVEQAGAIAQGLKDQVGEAAKHLKDQAGNIAESAKGLASDAGDKLRDTIAEQKAAGADYVLGVAQAVRRAAGEFDKELPQAAQYIRMAAERMDGVSNALRRRDINDIVGEVQDFARRQPTAFLGASVLAGFAIVRFLKSSTASPTARPSEEDERRGSAGVGSESGSGGSSQPSRTY